VMVFSSKPNRCIPVSIFLWIGKWYKFFCLANLEKHTILLDYISGSNWCWIIAENSAFWIKYHNSNVIPPFFSAIPSSAKPHSNLLCDAR
jgi:hypothetical protein